MIELVKKVMEVIDKNAQIWSLPRTRYEAIMFGSFYDNKTFTSIFAMRNKIKNKSYCRFFKICKGFYLNSETCVNGGGNYCGKFRKIYLIQEKIQKRRKLK